MRDLGLTEFVVKVNCLLSGMRMRLPVRWLACLRTPRSESCVARLQSSLSRIAPNVLICMSLTAVSTGYALPARLPIASIQGEHLKPISDLRSFGIQAACYKHSDREVLVGAIRRGSLLPLTAGYVRGPLHASFRRSLSVAQNRCRNFFLASPSPSPRPTNPLDRPIPRLAEWRANMLTHGLQSCRTVADTRLSFDERLAETYYDGEWVFFQIADYTDDPSWLRCAREAHKIYGKDYVLANAGAVPGYWNFSHGLTRAALSNTDLEAKSALLQLAHNAAYASDETQLAATKSTEFSREVAYTIMSYLNAEVLGESRRTRLAALVDQALGHIDQWCVSQRAPYVRPFMVALSAQALISFYDRSGDSRILPALRIAADWLWDRTWLPSVEAFMYTDRSTSSGGREPAPDLNLLIAPLYAWLYHQTGEEVYLVRGDLAFAGGVKRAYISDGKHFNQNYRWSFAYVNWRSQAPMAAGR